LLKFFAFFDLEKLIKIFTALLLERRLLIVSRDLENLTSCALSLENLIYPLEWFHAFAPIMPEHIDLFVFNQPFPFIYGVHQSVYEKINKSQIDEAVILLIDSKQVLNGDRDRLPDNIANYLRKKLRYFQESEANAYTLTPSLNNNIESAASLNVVDSLGSTNNSSNRINTEKCVSMLGQGPLQAFLDCVLMIIDDYREYIVFDSNSNEFKLNEEIYFQMKNVYSESSGNASALTGKNKYINDENEFYHEFRVTQAFEEVNIYLAFLLNPF
jgi:hypothetical protein